MNYKRQENELPLATAEWGWKYHHIGIPVNNPIKGSRHIPHLQLHVKGFDTSPFGVELMYFEDECPMDILIKTVPHIAFEVPNLDKAIEGFELLGEPMSPMKGVRIAMIKHNNTPIELMEFSE